MIAGALATTPAAINRDLSLLTRLPILSPKPPPSVFSPKLHRNTYTDSGATTNNTTTTQEQRQTTTTTIATAKFLLPTKKNHHRTRFAIP
jgi:hypothetical protein